MMTNKLHTETILCASCNSYHLDHSAELRAELAQARAEMVEAAESFVTDWTDLQAEHDLLRVQLEQARVERQDAIDAERLTLLAIGKELERLTRDHDHRTQLLQAEVERLQTESDGWRAAYELNALSASEQGAEVERLRAALEWYANAESLVGWVSEIERDAGQRARETLNMPASSIRELRAENDERAREIERILAKLKDAAAALEASHAHTYAKPGCAACEVLGTMPAPPN